MTSDLQKPRCDSRPNSFYAIVFACGLAVPVLLALACAGPAPVRTLSVDKTLIRKEAGHAYSVRYPSELDRDLLFFVKKPFAFNDTCSVLLEDGRPLEPAGGQAIADAGGGTCFFCLGRLYFSATDNSDPRTNRSTYVIRGPARPWFLSSKFIHLAAAFSGLLLVLAVRQGPCRSRVICGLTGGAVMLVMTVGPILMGSTLFTYMPDVVVGEGSSAGETLWDTVVIFADSLSYLEEAETRMPGYGFLLSCLPGRLSEFAPQEIPGRQPHALLNVTRAQIVLFAGAVFVLGAALAVLTRVGTAWLAGLLLSAFGFRAMSYLARVLTEGVLLSVVVLLSALVLWSALRPSIRQSVLLAVAFIAALLIHPRAIAWVPLLLAPALSLAAGARRLRALLVPAAWLPLLLVACFYAGGCAAGSYRYGAFSLTPFNGYSAVSVALEFADPDDYQLFQDAKVREIVRRALQALSASPHRWPDYGFVNHNVWATAAPICREVVGEDRGYYRGRQATLSTACNNIFSKVSAVLIARHPDRFMMHLRYAFRCMGAELPLAAGGHALWLGLLGMMLVWGLGWGRGAAIAGALFILAHYCSMLLTGALQGPLERYLLTTGWLLPLAAALLGVDGADLFIKRKKVSQVPRVH